jgi:crotonobetainyl-CoA:carnitine CoA-transferase CaiB-like acyl-CoA transferase
VIERTDLRTQPEFLSAPMRVENRDLLNDQLRPVFAKWGGSLLVEALSEAGLACANVNDVAAILEHPQLRERDFFSTWKIGDHEILAPGAPWRMMGNAPQPHDYMPAKTPGQDSNSVLADWLDASPETIQTLRTRGALG